MLEKPALKPKQPTSTNPFRAKLAEMQKSMGPEAVDGVKGDILEAFVSDGFNALNPEERKVLQKHMKPEMAWVIVKMLGKSIEPLVNKIMQGEEDMEGAPVPEPAPTPPSEFGPMSPQMSMGPASAPPALVGPGASETGGMAAPFPS